MGRVDVNSKGSKVSVDVFQISGARAMTLHKKSASISHRVTRAHAELMLRKRKMTPSTLTGWMAEKSVDAAALKATPRKFIRKSKGFCWIQGNGSRILEGALSQTLLVAGEQIHVMSRQGNQGKRG